MAEWEGRVFSGKVRVEKYSRSEAAPAAECSEAVIFTVFNIGFRDLLQNS